MARWAHGTAGANLHRTGIVEASISTNTMAPYSRAGIKRPLAGQHRPCPSAFAARAIAKSPGWHRHARSRRSKARRRIRAARSVGTSPLLRDIFLLAGHHSRPQYKEVFRPSMGKNGWQKWGGQGSTSTSWQWEWPSNAADTAQKNKKDQTYVFPKYSAMQVDSAGPPQSASTPKAEDGGTSSSEHLKQVQKLINYIRKAETRKQKIADTRKLRSEQWCLFEEELKRTFVAQKQAYCADIQKLDLEQMEVSQQKEKAVQDLKSLIGGHQLQDAPSSSTVKMSAEDASAWEALVQSASPGPTTAAMEEETDGWLRLALAGATSEAPPPMSEQQKAGLQAWIASQEKRPLTTPPRTSAGILPMTPPATLPTQRGALSHVPGAVPLEMSGNAMRPFYTKPAAEVAQVDPYHGSPGTGASSGVANVQAGQGATVPTIQGGEAHLPVTPNRTQFGKANARIPVKLASKRPPQHSTSPAMTFEQKVQAKREALQAAVDPAQHVAILDDDDDLLASKPTADGLTGME